MAERLANEEIAANEAKKLQRIEVLNTLSGRLTYGFSTKFFGNMAFSRAQNGLEEVVKNRNNFIRALGLNFEDLVVMAPVHGVNIPTVSRQDKFDPYSSIESTDGLITTKQGIALALNPADCAPIIITNKDAEFVAMVHSGRDGTDKGISLEAVKKLKVLGFVDPTQFLVGVGPAIRCYEQAFIKTQNPDFWMSFLSPKDRDATLTINDIDCPEAYQIRSSEGGKLKVDLVGAIVAQFISAGVPLENIEPMDYCTYCNAKKGEIFSHSLATEDRQYPNGRFMSVVCLNR